MSRIVFRLEANELVGFGHFMRCFAAARFLSKKYECCFAMGRFPQGISNQLMEFDMRAISVGFQAQFHPDACESLSELDFDLQEYLRPADIVVLDGYRFGPEYRRQLREAGVKVVQFFDHVDFEADVDGYITPLIFTDAERRRLQSGCQVFDGSNGFLIRPEFYQARRNLALAGPKTFVYATQEEAMAFYKELQKLAGTDVVALTNERFKDDCLQMGWDVVLHAEAEEVAEAMMACDTALLPASSVALEYLVVRGMAPFVFVTAENQREGFTRMLSIELWQDAEGFGVVVDNLQVNSDRLLTPGIELVEWMAELAR